MVYEPGGYNFMDYIKFGGPLQIVCGIFTVAIVFTLDYWWVYSLVFAFISVAAVVFFFMFNCQKPISHAEEADSDAKPSLLESGELQQLSTVGQGLKDADRPENGVGAVYKPEAHNGEAHKGDGRAPPPTTSSDVIFTGSA
jgi:hypothetical protein